MNILYRGEIKRAEQAGEDVAAVRTRLANEYTYNVASPFLAAERGELDGIIEPAQTRVSVAKALRALRNKRATLPPEEAREHPAMTVADDDDALSIEVRRGAPSEEELAAVVAVVSEAYTGEAAAAVADDRSDPDAWALSRRSLRTPLPRGLRWGAFGG